MRIDHLPDQSYALTVRASAGWRGVMNWRYGKRKFYKRLHNRRVRFACKKDLQYTWTGSPLHSLT